MRKRKMASLTGGHKCNAKCLSCRKPFVALSAYNRFCPKCQVLIDKEPPLLREKPTNTEDY